MESSVRPLRLGILFSGGGRTLENLEERIRSGSLPASIVVSVSSSAKAGGIERARRLGIPCKVVDFPGHSGTFSDDVTQALDEAQVDLVCLAGFLKLYSFPPRYEGRILNIHPSLLPAFGGKGFYGDRVHEAVLKSGAQFSGCTVHVVTARYDEGPIVIQRIVPVHPKDSVHDLAARVFREECIAYPEAIRIFAEGRLRILDGKASVREPMT